MRIPAHLRCTQCSILLHLIDICFLTCICLWHISLIQTCLRVVVSILPVFMKSIASHPAGPHRRLAQKRQSGPHCWGGRVRHNLYRVCQTAVTAPPRIFCVVVSQYIYLTPFLNPYHLSSSLLPPSPSLTLSGSILTVIIHHLHIVVVL